MTRPPTPTDHHHTHPAARNALAIDGADAVLSAVGRNLPHGFTVSRADLATAMLASLSDPATVHRHVAIAS